MRFGVMTELVLKSLSKVQKGAKPLGVVTAAALLVSGCSWVPDWANPFGDSRPVVSTAAAQPETPPAEGEGVTSAQTSEPVIQKGLVADANRTYSDTLRADDVDTQSAFATPTPQPSETQATSVAAAPASAPSLAPAPAPQPTPPVQAAVTPAPAPASFTPPPTSPDQNLFASGFTSGSFNRMPPVLENSGSQTVVISGAGVRHQSSASAGGSLTPVSTMPGFSPDVQSVPSYDGGPVTISSRGVNSPSTMINTPENGSFVPASTSQPSFNATPDSRAALVYFDTGSTQINGKARSALKAFVDVYQKQGGVIRVVGHASQRTKDMTYQEHVQVNFDVSLGRAQKVGQALVDLGIPADAILLEAKGSTEPEFLEIMPSGEARNRRVELFLEPKAS